MAASLPLLPDERVLELARHYLPSSKEVTGVFEDGYDHIVYVVDNAIVVKVPRSGEHPILLQREALILKQLAATPGLPIAKLIGYEVGRDAENPHVCMALVKGKQLESLPELADEKRRSLLQKTGGALAILHREPIEPFLSGAIFDVASTYRQYLSRSLRREWERGIRKLLELGLLSAADNERLESVYDQRERGFPDWPRVVLLHNDIRPAHILVDPNTSDLAVIIDFGDATLGAPEMDFYFMWMRWWDHREDVEHVLEGYLAEAEVGPQFVETLRFLRMVAAMRNADGRWCTPEEALAEVERVGTVDKLDAALRSS